MLQQAQSTKPGAPTLLTEAAAIEAYKGRPKPIEPPPAPPPPKEGSDKDGGSKPEASKAKG